MNLPFLRAALTKNKHFFILCGVLCIGAAFFAILMAINQRIPGSDDTVFQTQILPYHTVFDWVIYRYHSWSGRIFSEGFVYIFSSQPIYAWRIAQVFMYMMFSGTLFAYYKLVSNGQRSTTCDYIMLIAALCLPFLFDKSVLSEGGLWVTGSIVYFWTATFGLIGFYPVASYIKRQKAPHWLVTCLGLIATVIAASSQEQVGVILLGLCSAFTVYACKVSTSRTFIIARYSLLFWTITGCALLFSILAPGNALRFESEVGQWLPDFYTVSTLQHLEYGYRWMLEAFINHTGFLLVTSWIFIASLFAAKRHKRRIDYMLIAIFVLSCILALSKGNDAASYLLSFYPTWKPHVPNIFSSLNLVLWGSVLLLTAVSPLLLFPKKAIGYLLSVLFVAAFVSAALLVFSPTLYASEWRSFFIPSTVLLIIAYILLGITIARYSRYKYIIISSLTGLAITHYVFQLARLLHHFSP